MTNTMESSTIVQGHSQLLSGHWNTRQKIHGLSRISGQPAL